MVRHDPSDGVEQLTDLMRQASAVEARPVVDPAVRRRRRRRGIAAAVVIAVLAAAAGGYAGVVLTAPVGAPTGVTSLPEVAPPPAAAIAMPPDGVSAISVAGAEDYLGADSAGIWMASGGDDPRPMASISKIVTALVILDAKPLASADDPGPTITFDKADHELYDKYYVLGATIAAMPTGSSMSLHDALETMLVVSACNYAEAVSSWAFGSQGAFLAAAKRWLAANGFVHTRIVEPTGIDARNVSTPSELIALGRLAMANPAIASIVAMPSLDVPGLDRMPSTNTLLGSAGIRGIKTGTLEVEGSNLLFDAQLQVGIGHPIEVTGVVLGGFSRDSVNSEVLALLSSIVGGFHEVPVAATGQEVGTYTTPWGASARMVLAHDASVFTWSDTPITAEMTTTSVTSGVTGETVGSATWTAGDSTVTVPVVLDATIEQPDAWWRLTHPFELGG